jgi:hypothetical protein
MGPDCHASMIEALAPGDLHRHRCPSNAPHVASVQPDVLGQTSESITQSVLFQALISLLKQFRSTSAATFF